MEEVIGVWRWRSPRIAKSWPTMEHPVDTSESDPVGCIQGHSCDSTSRCLVLKHQPRTTIPTSLGVYQPAQWFDRTTPWNYFYLTPWLESFSIIGLSQKEDDGCQGGQVLIVWVRVKYSDNNCVSWKPYNQFLTKFRSHASVFSRSIVPLSHPILPFWNPD